MTMTMTMTMTSDHQLLQAFLGRRAALDGRPACERERADVGRSLRACLDRARDAFSAGELDARGFVAHVAERIATSEERSASIAQSLDAAHAADLYLAFAALRGQRWAVERLCVLVRAELARSLRAAPADVRDEVEQRLLVRLIRPLDGSEPRLGQYRGSAALRTWIRIIATREYRALARHQSRFSSAAHEVETLRGVMADTPLSFRRAEHRQLFKSAFQRAFSGLSIHDRTLLRQHYGSALGVTAMARMHGLHRGTMARRLAQIRERLLNAIAGRFYQELGIDRRDFAALIASMQHDIELSLSRLFGELPGDS